MENERMDNGTELHRTMRSELVGMIREDILGGRYLPGQRLLEEEISSKYQVSRTPIREAFVVLEQEGLVEIKPHMGVFVSSFSTEEIVDLLHVEAAMEGLAAAEAASKIRPREFAQLVALQEQMTLADVPMGAEQFYHYDQQFHSLLVRCSQSPTMIRILEKQLSQMYLCRHYTITAPQRYHHSIREHQEIIESIRLGDRKRAEKAAKDHLESVISDFITMSEGTDGESDRESK
jgi:DNA-binding GntR family transcriptional regulator